MKLIYTSEDRFMVWGVINTLELAGYECHIRNEYAAGGAGDIAPIDTWPEVWLDNDIQYEDALNYLENNILQKISGGQDWVCSRCGETNGSAFEFCWNCANEAGKD